MRSRVYVHSSPCALQGRELVCKVRIARFVRFCENHRCLFLCSTRSLSAPDAQDVPLSYTLAHLPMGESLQSGLPSHGSHGSSDTNRVVSNELLLPRGPQPPHSATGLVLVTSPPLSQPRSERLPTRRPPSLFVRKPPKRVAPFSSTGVHESSSVCSRPPYLTALSNGR